MLDLGGIDVHPARYDHVGRPVADIEITVAVEIAHVAERDQAVPLDLAARLRQVAVAEVGIGRLAHMDEADLARRAGLAVLGQDGDARGADRPAAAAGTGECFLRADHGHHAALARRIGLVDDRAEPVDHGALDLRRAGRARRGDEAQRGEIVSPPHRLGQLQQPHIHGRHEIDDVDPVLGDETQHLLLAEARRQHHQLRLQRRHLRDQARRAVIERRGDQHAAARLDAEGRPGDVARALLHRLGLSERHGIADDAFRPAGRARRIGHVAARRDLGSVIGRRFGEPGGIVGDAGSAADREHRQAGRKDCLRRVEQRRMADHHAGAAVGDQKADFGGREMPVDRAIAEAADAAGEDHVDIGRAVVEQDGDDIALLQAEPRKPAGQAAATLLDLDPGPGLAFETQCCGRGRRHDETLAGGGVIAPGTIARSPPGRPCTLAMMCPRLTRSGLPPVVDRILRRHSERTIRGCSTSLLSKAGQ